MIKRLEQGKEIDLYSHLINVTSGQTQPLWLKHTTPSTFLNEMKFIKQLHKAHREFKWSKNKPRSRTFMILRKQTITHHVPCANYQKQQCSSLKLLNVIVLQSPATEFDRNHSNFKKKEKPPCPTQPPSNINQRQEGFHTLLVPQWPKDPSPYVSYAFCELHIPSFRHC